MAAYGSLCTEFYDLDKRTAPPKSLAFYLDQARKAGGRVLEPMCGSGRFLLPMAQAGVPIDGVDSSPAMVEACRAHASRLGIDVRIHLQEVASLELPHRYSMAFVPSGSIGLVAESHELRRTFSRLRSHLEPRGRLFLELPVDEPTPSRPTELAPRTVACPDGSSITYSCIVSQLALPDTIRFSGTYTKCKGTRVLRIEEEELTLRFHRPEHIAAELAACGFGKARMSSASDEPFLDESGCALVEAGVDD